MRGLAVFFLIFFVIPGTGSGNSDEAGFTRQRRAMVALLEDYGIRDKRVLSAMGKIKRHLFIPEKYREVCSPYGNHPCPIGFGQTISQPYIVAYMTERLNVRRGEKVLEIGAGSGYQSAVLAEIGATVVTLEIVPELSDHASVVLKEQGYAGVKVFNSSGYMSCPAEAPFDAVILTCAPEKVPESLTRDLKEGGRMILPVGKYFQELLFIRKVNGKLRVRKEMNVRFVPMVK